MLKQGTKSVCRPNRSGGFSALYLKGRNSIPGNTPQVAAALLPTWRALGKFPAGMLSERSGKRRHSTETCFKTRLLAFRVVQARFWEALLRSPAENHGWRHLAADCWQPRCSSGCQDPLLKLYFFIRSCLRLAKICRHNIINSSAYFHKIYLFNTFSELVNHSFFNVLLAAWKTGIYVTSSGPQTFSC